MKRFALIFLTAAFLVPAVYAQNGVSVDVTTRASLNYSDDALNFSAEYLAVDLVGYVSDNFAVAVRQNLNQPIMYNNVFAATDWAFFTWIWKEKFELSAGKIVTAYGSSEVNSNTWDVFQFSRNAFVMDYYVPGINFGYRFTDNDYFQLQLTRSPFAYESNSGLKAVNLCWRGVRERWKPVVSVNLFEIAKGAFESNIAMSNNIKLGDFDINADIVLRSRLGRFDFIDDFTVLGEGVWSASDKLKVTAKMIYERNGSFEQDRLVPSGYSGFTAGAGAYYYPMNNFRVHALAFLNRGVPFVSVGATWSLKIL